MLVDVTASDNSCCMQAVPNKLVSKHFESLICCSGRPERASTLQVRLGGILATDPEPDAVYANVSHVIPHPHYRSSVHQNDVGLLRLTRPVVYTDTILPICLPSPNVNLDQFKVCVDTGFGRTAYTGLSVICMSYVCVYLFMYLLCTQSHTRVRAQGLPKNRNQQNPLKCDVG